MTSSLRIQGGEQRGQQSQWVVNSRIFMGYFWQYVINPLALRPTIGDNCGTRQRPSRCYQVRGLWLSFFLSPIIIAGLSPSSQALFTYIFKWSIFYNSHFSFPKIFGPNLRHRFNEHCTTFDQMPIWLGYWDEHRDKWPNHRESWITALVFFLFYFLWKEIEDRLLSRWKKRMPKMTQPQSTVFFPKCRHHALCSLPYLLMAACTTLMTASFCPSPQVRPYQRLFFLRFNIRNIFEHLVSTIYIMEQHQEHHYDMIEPGCPIYHTQMLTCRPIWLILSRRSPLSLWITRHREGRYPGSGLPAASLPHLSWWSWSRWVRRQVSKDDRMMIYHQKCFSYSNPKENKSSFPLFPLTDV
mgnify:CR=1 FL=1